MVTPTMNKKSPAAKRFCLFHEKTGCSCLNLVLDKETLIRRLQQEIKLNDFVNRSDPDVIQKARRDQENLSYRIRLQDLQN